MKGEGLGLPEVLLCLPSSRAACLDGFRVLGFRVQGLGFRVLGLGVQGLGFRVLGFRVQGLGFRVLGF